eukprot:PhF_6_TR31724/c1_g1_i1/m.46689
MKRSLLRFAHPSAPVPTKDIRLSHCLLCCTKVTEWSSHLATPRHVTYKALGSHFNSFLPQKARQTFDAGLYEALGVKPGDLSRERIGPTENRRLQLGNLVRWLLSDAVYPMKTDPEQEEYISRCKLIGTAVARKELTLMLCRLHPTWPSLPLQAFAELLLEPKHITRVVSQFGNTDVLSKLDYLSVLGHFQIAEDVRRDQVVLTTLTRHCIDASVFEMYSMYVWDVMPQISAVWDIYVAHRHVAFQSNHNVQCVRVADRQPLAAEKQQYVPDDDVNKTIHHPTTPIGRVNVDSVCNLVASSVSAKLVRLDGFTGKKASTTGPVGVAATMMTSSSSQPTTPRMQPLVSQTKRKKMMSAKPATSEMLKTLSKQCRC